MVSPTFRPSRIFKLKVELRYLEPSIFRTLVVPDTTTLHAFHLYIQAAFGWTNTHLYLFQDQERRTYSSMLDHVIGRDLPSEDIEATEVHLKDLLGSRGDPLFYLYDFGDSWEHDVTVLSVETPRARGHYPAVIDGARRCPLEDCGGPFGYEEAVEVWRKHRAGEVLDEEEQERLECITPDFDPEVFDLDRANVRLNGIGRLS